MDPYCAKNVELYNKSFVTAKDTMLKMFLAWFHVPVTATKWLWERYGIFKTLSTSVTTTNRGQDFFYDIVAWSIRHKIISSSGTTQTTNTTWCEPSCVSRQCRKSLICNVTHWHYRKTLNCWIKVSHTRLNFTVNTYRVLISTLGW